MGRGQIGIDADGIAAGYCRFAEMALVAKRTGEVEMGCSQVGFDADRLPCRGGGLPGPPTIAQRMAEIGKTGRIVRVVLDGLTEQFDGRVGAATWWASTPSMFKVPAWFGWTARIRR